MTKEAPQLMPLIPQESSRPNPNHINPNTITLWEDPKRGVYYSAIDNHDIPYILLNVQFDPDPNNLSTVEAVVKEYYATHSGKGLIFQKRLQEVLKTIGISSELRRLEQKYGQTSRNFATQFFKLMTKYGVLVPGPLPPEFEETAQNKGKPIWMKKNFYDLLDTYPLIGSAEIAHGEQLSFRPERMQKVPERVLETWETAEQIYPGLFEILKISPLTFKGKQSYPYGWTPPDRNFLHEAINSLDFPETWILWDKTTRVSTDPTGKETHSYNFHYQKDPLASFLEESRKFGKILIDKHTAFIPKKSRFGISQIELTQYILPTLAKQLRLKQSKERITLPPYILFYYLAHSHAPQLMAIDSGEFMQENKNGIQYSLYFESQRQLLSAVSFGNSFRISTIGFRPMVVFLDQPA